MDMYVPCPGDGGVESEQYEAVTGGSRRLDMALLFSSLKIFTRIKEAIQLTGAGEGSPLETAAPLTMAQVRSISVLASHWLPCSGRLVVVPKTTS